MKRASLVIAVSALAASQVSPCLAATVREQSYAYEYGDSVKAVVADAFTICEGCKTDALHKEPMPFVTLQANRPRVYQTAEIDTVAPDHRSEVQKVSEDVEEGLLGTVLFRFDSDNLSVDEKHKLDRIVATLPGETELIATGYACTVGTKVYNQNLSEKRAMAVAGYLKSKGLNVAHEAKGECCPTSTTNKKLNRRVEIEKGRR